MRAPRRHSETAEIKGRPELAAVIAGAVRDRERAPDLAYDLELDSEEVTIEPVACSAAIEAARSTKQPHNLARTVFVETMIDALTEQVATRLGTDVFGTGLLIDPAEVAEIRAELAESPILHDELDRIWPYLSPQELLTDLFGSPERLEIAAGEHLSGDDWKRLSRDSSDEWTPADVPLLDEAAELLGVDDTAETESARRERERQIEYAQGALEIDYGSRSMEFEDEAEDNEEILAAHDLIDAESLAERHDERDTRPVAVRAVEDRSWIYGHIIIDEAQELSPMDWRFLLRRCPSRSITAVGDTAQTSSPAGTDSWQDRLEPLLDSRWDLRQLTVNYRNPAEVAELAGTVLLGPAANTVPRSVRRSGHPPTLHPVGPDEVIAEVGRQVEALGAQVDGGTVAVIAPDRLVRQLGESAGDESGPAPVAVMTAPAAKGLEFDAVVVVEPDLIASERARGRNDLYVALTRTTDRLAVVHSAPLEALAPVF